MVYLTVTSGRTIRMTWFILFDIRGSIPKGKKSMYDKIKTLISRNDFTTAEKLLEKYSADCTFRFTGG